MDPKDARKLALELILKHRLLGWGFAFDSAKSRMGRCDYLRQRIQLSEPLTLMNTEAQVKDTLLHEIAHALVGPGHKHGPVWRRKAQEVGCSPRWAIEVHKVQLPPSKANLVCDTCSYRIPRYRIHRQDYKRKWGHKGCSGVMQLKLEPQEEL